MIMMEWKKYYADSLCTYVNIFLNKVKKNTSKGLKAVSVLNINGFAKLSSTEIVPFTFT